MRSLPQAPPAGTIPAIPTEYGGVHFRSRLEAKWAAFFDLVGWTWEYEPVDLRGWIPDFALCTPDVPVIMVEVKPVFSFPPDVAEKINRSECPVDALIVGAGNPLRTPAGCGPGWSGTLRSDGARAWLPANYVLSSDTATSLSFTTSRNVQMPDLDLIITGRWREAANLTQWSRSSRGLQRMGEML